MTYQQLSSFTFEADYQRWVTQRNYLAQITLLNKKIVGFGELTNTIECLKSSDLSVAIGFEWYTV